MYGLSPNYNLITPEKEMTRMKDEPNWYEQDAMSVNSTPTSPESERKKTTSESMSSDKGDKGQVWTWF